MRGVKSPHIFRYITVCDLISSAGTINNTSERVKEMLTKKSILFGHYLLKKGVIKFNDIIEARLLQMKHNRKIGELAVEKGLFSRENKNGLLVLQEEIKKKVGEIAVERNYLTEKQLEELLKYQNAHYLLFGEALVKIGAIAEDDLNKNFEEFTTMQEKL